ncbi:MAG TPA: hypothetical protein VJ739_04250 [Gemmataceae bacterium]|nr:hypothetical protein [Gemmataceae bacterium]
MTLTGKVLVLLNLTLSLAMAFWAVGVCAQYIDYSTDARGSAEQTKGLVLQRNDQIAARQEQLKAAEARWRGPYDYVPRIMQQRVNNQEWYGQQLAAMQKGGPVKAVSYKAGQVELDPKQYGRPLLVDATDADGQPLQTLESYLAALADANNAIHLAQVQMEQQTRLDTELTQKIGGDNGLRFLLAREQKKLEDVLAEQHYLEPLLVNSLVEGELLLKRQADLEARVKELKAVGVASSR